MTPRALISAAGLCMCLAARGTPSAEACGWEPPAEAQSGAAPSPDAAFEHQSLKERWIHSLPASISDGLEIDAWGWASALHNNLNDYWDLELALAITKTFNQRVTVSAQGNFIDANGQARVELGQGYISTLLSDAGGGIFTIGKFNANFGVEPRDFWNRRTGTTSLLFGAQPQDIVGAMLTQPIGDSGVKLRPFISADFQGGYNFDQPPCGGLSVEYRPNSNWQVAVTGLIGPGFVLFGGRPLRSPYPRGAYGSDPGAVVENWQGPNFVAERAGTLHYLQAKAVWRPTADLTLAGEFLLGSTDSSTGQWGWSGWMAMAQYHLTDRLHVFGRFSYLDDPHWLVTGFFQTAREVSAGFGYELLENIELRGEYRHDFSNANPDMDSLSIHLTFTY